MLAVITSLALVGLEGELVQVEVDLTRGLPGLTLVGLPDKSVEEAKERVRSAIINSGQNFPVRHIIINLAPANLKKVGPAYDLSIALGILAADQQIKPLSDTSAFLGELSLNGAVRPITGVLALALSAKKRGLDTLYVPMDNSAEAASVKDLTIYAIRTLKELIAHLASQTLLNPVQATTFSQDQQQFSTDFGDIQGQEFAKRALEIAAAGGHNVLMSGPPGAGKTLLSNAFPSILPPMTEEEILEVTKIHSIAGVLPFGIGLLTTRPIRSPHHTASAISLIGGGAWPKPGEISLAHRGVLFMDELPEFPRSVLEVLRQPLEDGIITVSRAARSLTFPAKFILLAAQNPCPCGRAGTPECTCSSQELQRYQRKISGPFLDRIDMQFHVAPVERQALIKRNQGETSHRIRKRVAGARVRQQKRLSGTIACNAEMPAKIVQALCKIDNATEHLLIQALEHYKLSARAYHRILKLARTIADLEASKEIAGQHVTEALQYRVGFQEEYV
ncbi:YifB family Mg chelatase-like AAA ATPase [Candidatus Berkelbacteria bacterium]|nr:YifB family Mg chelatase-like AAA ATPase [Candidatus Berkelbacteria bacterium]